MVSNIFHWLATDTTGLILTLFVCLAAGYAIGKVKIGTVSLGATVGTLLVAVIIAIIVGKTAVFNPPEVLRSLFNGMFIFALGYDVGPAFVKSLKSSGLRLIVMAFVFAVVSLGVGIACHYIFNLGGGVMVGLFAGTMTQSSILGAGQSMMSAMGITGESAAVMNSEMTAAFALGYLISYAGCVILIKSVLPNLLGCKGPAGLKDAVKQTGDRTHYTGDTQRDSVIGSVRLRTFRVEEAPHITVAGLQEKFEERIQVEIVMRHKDNGQVEMVDFDNETTLCKGDVVALIGDLEKMLEVESINFTEVTEHKYQKAAIAKEKMVLTKDLETDKMQSLFSEHVIIVSAVRDGKPVQDTKHLKHGDVLTLMGIKTRIQAVMKEFGYPVNASDESDIVYMSCGMVIGIIIGILTIRVAGIPFSLGTSGGIVFLGIFCGWYNDKKPHIGYISPGARWLMKSIGLNVFVACLGLGSGASFLAALKEMGVLVIIAICIMSFLPHVIMVLFAKYVLHLDPVEALGGTCGAGTNTGALNGLTEVTGSSIFAVSCTPAYATGCIFLTFLGTISVAMFH